MQIQNQQESKKQTKSEQKTKKGFSYLEGGSKPDPNPESNVPWKQKLNKNVSGQQSNAEDFTKQFMSEMYSNKQEMKQEQSVDEHYEEMLQYAQQQEKQEQLRSINSEASETVPALPPKTKIMFSPSRHLFSPSESVDDSDTTSVNTVEYVPVKEKVKLIAQQQEEIVRREEQRKMKGEGPAGGVRILPPSPVTVRKETNVSEVASVQSSSTTIHSVSFSPIFL